jgi:hypothetical protein
MKKYIILVLLLIIGSLDKTINCREDCKERCEKTGEGQCKRLNNGIWMTDQTCKSNFKNQCLNNCAAEIAREEKERQICFQKCERSKRNCVNTCRNATEKAPCSSACTQDYSSCKNGC